MSSNFVPVDRVQQYLFPPSIQDWLPENHLAIFVVDIVSQLDFATSGGDLCWKRGQGASPASYFIRFCSTGMPPVFSPAGRLKGPPMIPLLSGIFPPTPIPTTTPSPRFANAFLNISPLFKQILLLAREMGFLKLGKVSLDGTKIKANASRHHALSWDYANKLEQQLQAEVDELIRLAEKADSENIPDGMDIPEELSRRQDRLDAIAKAKEQIEQRAAKRYDQEQQEYEKKVAVRREKAAETGRKPKPPESGPRKNDQVNLTDEESRIMPSSGKGFDQTYNAQAGVDIATMMIVESHVSQAPNDKQEITPALVALTALPEQLGQVEALLADAGYYSEDNVASCVSPPIKN